ncbi:MAG: thioredoxin family protein, partial [Omnitrophica WOR_2 bacterium]
ADENQDLLRMLGISGVPTLIAFRQGKEVRRVVGAQPQPSLEKLFKTALDEQDSQEEGLSLNSRFFRLALGLFLVILGWPVIHSLILSALGGIVLFSAVYDRCPIYQAISPRITAAFRKLFA